MKVKALAIAPYEGLAIQLEATARLRDDIDVKCLTGDLDEGLLLARSELDGSYDVVISRGGTADLLRENGFTVVEIPITLYDLLRAIRQASGARKRYAIVGFEPVTRNASFLQDVLQSDTSVEIHTLHRAEDADRIMHHLQEDGFELVICDQISAMTASRYRLNYILVDSGKESIDTALDEAALVGRQKAATKDLVLLYNELLSSCPDITVLFRGQEIISADRRMEKLSKGFLTVMRSRLQSLAAGQEASFEYDDDELLYSASVRKFRIASDDFTIFYIQRIKSPFSLEKSGIVLRNAAWARDQFLSSFYGSTSRSAAEVGIVEAYARRPYPLLIYGERGTGKGNLAQLAYVSSAASSASLYDIDLQLAGDKAISFIRDLYEARADRKAVFHFKNIDKVDEAVLKAIIDLNEELELSHRAYLIASATLERGAQLPPQCMEYVERLQCLTLRTRCLDEHRQDIPSMANLYIASLNRRNGTETISIEDSGMELLVQHSWSGNNDQLARTLKRLNAMCFDRIIKEDDVRRLLGQEDELQHGEGQHEEASPIPLEGTLRQMEEAIVRKVLAEEKGNRTRTAKRLGLSRATLWRMLQED